jgi:hypothetical protein
MIKKKPFPTAHDIRRIAVEARCGDRSVRTFFRGGGIRNMTRLRIVEAIAAIGIAAPSEGLTPPASGAGAAARASSREDS